MLNITKNINGDAAEFKLEGRLDTVTAPELESVLKQSLEGIKDLTFDFQDLEYISSAGLRILLSAQKTMSSQGKMVVENVNETIMEIFEVTGFCEVLTIK
jgi:anti-sigma B factor antagonist